MAWYAVTRVEYELLTAHSPRGRAHGASVLLAASLYVLVLAASPLLHHDFACHQRAPGHCGACIAQPSALRAPDSIGISAQRLADAGPIEARVEREPRLSVAVPTPGRSPPGR
jgi:hypothetical protein